MLTCGLGQAVSVAVVTELPLLQMENIVCGKAFIVTDCREKTYNYTSFGRKTRLQLGRILALMLVISSEYIFI